MCRLACIYLEWHLCVQLLIVDPPYVLPGIDITKEEQRLLSLASAIHGSDATVFKGLYSHSGHSYSTAPEPEIQRIADTEMSTMEQIVKCLASLQIPVRFYLIASYLSMTMWI